MARPWLYWPARKERWPWRSRGSRWKEDCRSRRSGCSDSSVATLISHRTAGLDLGAILTIVFPDCYVTPSLLFCDIACFLGTHYRKPSPNLQIAARKVKASCRCRLPRNLEATPHIFKTLSAQQPTSPPHNCGGAFIEQEKSHAQQNYSKHG